MYENVLIASVDDDAIDRDLFRRALTKMGFQGVHKSFDKGSDLFDWLAMQNAYEGHREPRPSVVFLDINLPINTGKDILRQIREDVRTSATPVVMVSGSNADRDFRECIGLGANGYLIKTSDPQAFQDAMNCLIGTWALLSNQFFI